MKTLLTMAFLSLILASCTPFREVRFDVLENSVASAFPEIESTNSIDKSANFIVQRMQKLEYLVSEIEGVEKPRIAILENTALVSLESNEGISKQDLKAKKKIIEYKIRQVDPSIKYVHVSATDDMIEKINEVLGKISSYY